MQTFNSISEAGAAVRRWIILNEATLPEHLKDRLIALEAAPSHVDVIVTFTQAVYANRDGMPAEALELAAGCADYADQMGYHESLNGEASTLTRVLRRESGEPPPTDNPWPAKEDDPEPKAGFAVPEPEPEPALEPAAADENKAASGR